MAPSRKGSSSVKKDKPATNGDGRDIRLLGQKLKVLMGYYGIANYRELSRRVGVGFETLRLLHTGEGSNPNIKNLYPLAKFYDVPIEMLVNDSIAAEDILQWVGTRFVMDQPEQRLRCTNLRTLIKTLGYDQVTERITAYYYDANQSLVAITVGQRGDILYHGSERRRLPDARRQEP
jgi:transcriptional regulator with XRE-family HTH domain